jgi:hypothetical protein
MNNPHIYTLLPTASLVMVAVQIRRIGLEATACSRVPVPGGLYASRDQATICPRRAAKLLLPQVSVY